MGQINAKRISDKEFIVGETIIKIRDDGIVYIEAHGIQNVEIARQHIDYYNKFGIISDKYPYYLINLNEAGKATTGARKIWRTMGDMPSVKKVAFYGLHSVARVLASFIIGLSQKASTYFFSTEEEAINWLKNEV